MKTYRNDIDGLRAIAVLAVIVFHLGYLPNGYLGVDVFFVISGYLITSIIYRELLDKKFSIVQFYERRIRRILPLLFFVSGVALLLGVIFMLPDDLENLAQAVIASNLSVNNILMLLTSSDYWSVKNEYKPLMHTWSLGIEEQFYLVYPFLLLLVSKFRLGWLKYLLLVITALSLLLFVFVGNEASKFYLLHYRFFELSIGGFFAILFYQITKAPSYARLLFYVSSIALFIVLIFPYTNNTIAVILVSILSVLVLTFGKYLSDNDLFSKYLLQNKVVSYIGKISFSLYLWHQLVFAFSRYAFLEEINAFHGVLLFAITFFLSVLSYHFIENTFRNKRLISNVKVYSFLALLFLISTSSAAYIYLIGGVYKDFPAAGLYKSDIEERGLNFFSSSDNIHIHYNEVVRKQQRSFESGDKLKVLVVGNSFGRDVTNIFLETTFSSALDVRYFDINKAAKAKKAKKTKLSSGAKLIKELWTGADLIVVSAKEFLSKESILEIGLINEFEIDMDQVVCFGTKDFGYSNGIHYNRLESITDFTQYFCRMKDGVLEVEAKLNSEWGEKYVSLISRFINENAQIRVFTDDGQFISPDCIHLTKPGAVFYAKELHDEIERLLLSVGTPNQKIIQ